MVHDILLVIDRRKGCDESKDLPGSKTAVCGKMVRSNSTASLGRSTHCTICTRESERARQMTRYQQEELISARRSDGANLEVDEAVAVAVHELQLAAARVRRDLGARLVQDARAELNLGPDRDKARA